VIRAARCNVGDRESHRKTPGGAHAERRYYVPDGPRRLYGSRFSLARAGRARLLQEGNRLADAGKPRLEVAALFYALCAAGITILVVQPALYAGEWHKAVILGAVFGLCAYGTYDLTNLATLRRWSFRLALVDMAWGTFLTAIASLAGFVASRLAGA